MSLRFFADHCVSNAIIDHLGSQGHGVLRLRDHLDPESPDPIVIARAQELGAILLSPGDCPFPATSDHIPSHARSSSPFSPELA